MSKYKRKTTFKDLTNQRFGKLVAIQVWEPAKNSRGVLWKCHCDCGSDHLVRSTDLIKSTRSCGCSKILPNNGAAVNYVMNNYKKDAKYAGRAFKLSETVFRELIFNNCYYCNASPSNTYQRKERKYYLKYNGIDRVNSNRGYFKDNCVTACFACNQAKHTMSQDQFYDWIKVHHDSSL